jgi:hypothetical protein
VLKQKLSLAGEDVRLLLRWLEPLPAAVRSGRCRRSVKMYQGWSK